MKFKTRFYPYSLFMAFMYILTHICNLQGCIRPIHNTVIGGNRFSRYHNWFSDPKGNNNKAA